MADTATVASGDTTNSDPGPDSWPADASTGALPDTPDPVQAAPDEDAGRAPRRGRPRAVPMLVHGTNTAGAAVGAAYIGGGPLAAAAMGTAAVGAAGAALVRRRRAAARRGTARAGRSGSGRRLGRASSYSGSGGYSPSGYRGRGSLPFSGRGRWSAGGSPFRPGGGGGRSRSPRSRAGGPGAAGVFPAWPGRSGPSPRRGMTGPWAGTGSHGPGRGASWLPGSGRLPGTAGGRGAEAGPSSASASGAKDRWEKPSRAARPHRAGRALDALKRAAARARDRLRDRLAGRTPGSASEDGTSRQTAAARARQAVTDRWYRLRRAAIRRLLHAARCTGAGLLAALAALATAPLGVLWGLGRLVGRHHDPLHAWLLPVRIAGRIWRRLYRRSRRRRDHDAAADQLTLTVNDPRKEIPMSGSSSLTTSTVTLNGHQSKFAQAMGAAYAGYTSYQPRSMMEIAAEYAGLPSAIRATAESVQLMAINSDAKYPCSKRAVAKVVEAYEKLMLAASRAESMVTLFREVHAFDIERIVNPRTNEWMWNVTSLSADAPEGAMLAPGKIESGCVLMSVLYRTYEPLHMMQVGTEYAGVGMGLNSLAGAIGVLHERTRDEYPVDDRVTNELAIIMDMVRTASDDAALAARLFATDHAREISHNTHPRKGVAAEGMWNAPR